MSATEPANSPQEADRAEPVEAVFEVIVHSSLGVAHPMYHFKLWGDGRTEGFDRLGKSLTVVNRFPLMLEQVAQALREFVADLDDAIDDLTPQNRPAQGEATDRELAQLRTLNEALNQRGLCISIANIEEQAHVAAHAH